MSCEEVDFIAIWERKFDEQWDKTFSVDAVIIEVTLYASAAFAGLAAIPALELR